MVQLAARVTGAPYPSIVAAHLTWIDSAGLDLDGGRRPGLVPRAGAEFDRPLESIDDLARKLHRLTR